MADFGAFKTCGGNCTCDPAQCRCPPECSRNCCICACQGCAGEGVCQCGDSCRCDQGCCVYSKCVNCACIPAECTYRGRTGNCCSCLCQGCPGKEQCKCGDNCRCDKECCKDCCSSA